MPATQETLADGVAVSDAYDGEGRPVQMHRVAADHDPVAAWPAVLASSRLNAHDFGNQDDPLVHWAGEDAGHHCPEELGAQQSALNPNDPDETCAS